MSWRGSTTIQDRIFASLPYLLPLTSSVAFAGSVLQEFPALGNVLAPLLFPVVLVYRTVPFASLIVFFALFFLVVRNEKVPHFIRFNTMQALLVDILMFVFDLILPILGRADSSNLLVVALSSSVFLGVLAIVVFSVVQSLRGLYAEIPTLSEAVYMQVR
ncbi:Tic20 family protein [Altericista sp. CCNU0014]|uniref:Tic20 family protein n=1 Tax=Altericista sp. CCNU0014 TaxID=3082949 RepID=UPI00384AE86A